MVVVVVVVGIGADAADMVVMPLLRRAGRGFVADHLRPVFAEAAIPPGLAVRDLADAVGEAVQHEIMISHGPIPTLRWDAMTMGFKLPPTGLPVGIAVGDRVGFDFRSAGGGFEIASIARSPPATPGAHDGAHAAPPGQPPVPATKP